MSVDGKPAVCHSMRCDYNYIDPVGLITAFSYVDGTKTLSVVGTDLPDIADISNVEFAKSLCVIDQNSLTPTGFDCILSQEATCGTFSTILRSKFGLVPVDAGAANIDVLCTITSASPVIEINVLGQDNITISGTNLPYDVTTSDIKLVFSDPDSTTCVPQISKTDELVCLTSQFDKVAGLS